MIDVDFWFDKLFWFESVDTPSYLALLVNIVTLIIVVFLYFMERIQTRLDYQRTVKELLKLVVEDVRKQTISMEEYHDLLSGDKLNRKIQPVRYVLNNLESLVELDLVVVHRVFRHKRGLTLRDCNSILGNTRYFIFVFSTFFEQHFRKREEVNTIIINHTSRYFENFKKLYDETLFIIGGNHGIEFNRDFYYMTLEINGVITTFNNEIGFGRKHKIEEIHSELVIPLRSIIDSYSGKIIEQPDTIHQSKFNFYISEMTKVVSDVSTVVEMELEELEKMSQDWEPYIKKMELVLNKF